MFLTSNTRF